MKISIFCLNTKNVLKITFISNILLKTSESWSITYTEQEKKVVTGSYVTIYYNRGQSIWDKL